MQQMSTYIVCIIRNMQGLWTLNNNEKGMALNFKETLGWWGKWRIKPTIKIQISGERPIDCNENT